MPEPMSEADLTIYRNQVIVNDYLSKMRGELIDEIDRLRAENVEKRTDG